MVVWCRVEGNPLYYLLLLEASAMGVVAEVTDTCMAGYQHFCCMGFTWWE